MTTGAEWLHVIDEVLRFETTPAWAPLASARDLGERLFTCSFFLKRARRGGWEGGDAWLTESFEGATVDCAAPRGSGTEWSGVVRLVQDPDESGVVTFTLRLQSGRHPHPDDCVRVFPSPFLRGARKWLAERPEAAHAPYVEAELRRRIAAGLPLQRPGGLPVPALPSPLRAQQKAAFQLSGLPIGVCWGPPGTGKTTTLSALIAALVRSGERVLVVTPTRVAADGACLGIDRMLTVIGHPRARGDLLRVHAPQLAAQFREQNPDLLVWEDERSTHTEALIRAREANERARADILRSGGALADSARKAAAAASELEEQLQERWRARQAELVTTAKVVVSTVRTAINQEYAKSFRHIVVDEASMVSLSDGLLVAWQQRLGGNPEGSILLFGDHKQLGPIVPRLLQDGDDAAAEAAPYAAAPPAVAAMFGRDVLSEVMEGGGAKVTVMLDEQSRMNPSLCAVVSEMSYEGRLRAVNAPPGGLPPELPAGICVLDPEKPPTWLRDTWRRTPREYLKTSYSPAQSEVAQASVALARYLTSRGRSVVVCTPFRGQASLLRRGLADLSSVRCGTVHRMQGQEADVCIFDPCKPTSWFIRESPDARRLIIVAASRAKHVLVISNAPRFLDLNPLLAPYLRQAHRL